MSKIYFFGDSFIENLGCRPNDRYYLETYTGKEKTWTTLLSEIYNLEEVNLGKSGFTNYNTLNTIWSYIDTITENDKVVIRIGPYDRYNIDSNDTDVKEGDLLKVDKSTDTPIYFIPIANDTSSRFIRKLSGRLNTTEIDAVMKYNTYLIKTNKFRKQFIKNAFNNISLQLKSKNINHFIFDDTFVNFYDDWNDIKNLHNIVPGHMTWEQHERFVKLIQKQL